MSFTLAGFAAHLAAMVIEVEHETKEALERAAQLVATEAKAEIGIYQDAAGPFAEWPELADSTKADRVSKGFSENKPLLRTGGLRDSIEHQVSGDTAHVGSDSDVAVYQELGTARGIPPRSFLGGAAFRKEHEIRQLAGESAVAVIEGKKAV